MIEFLYAAGAIVLTLIGLGAVFMLMAFAAAVVFQPMRSYGSNPLPPAGMIRPKPPKGPPAAPCQQVNTGPIYDTTRLGIEHTHFVYPSGER